MKKSGCLYHMWAFCAGITFAAFCKHYTRPEAEEWTMKLFDHIYAKEWAKK